MASNSSGHDSITIDVTNYDGGDKMVLSAPCFMYGQRNATLDDIAGLTVYMENDAHADIYLRQDKSNKKQSVVLEYTLYGLKYKACEVSVGKGAARLKVEGTKTEYVFSYRDAKGKWTEAGRLDTRLLSTETAGGFTGITLGLFAVSKKGGGFSAADFKYYNYK